MPITIKGIRVDYVSLERDNESNRTNIKEARYSLISSTEHVLATQSVHGYQGLAMKPSPGTIKALEEFMQLYKTDVLTVLGLDLT